MKKHRKKELNRKIAVQRQGFSLPPEISFIEIMLGDDHYTYVFTHEEIGELGRITVAPLPDGRTQLNCELKGDPNDTMTAKREEIFEPVAKELVETMSKIVG